MEVALAAPSQALPFLVPSRPIQEGGKSQAIRVLLLNDGQIVTGPDKGPKGSEWCRHTHQKDTRGLVVSVSNGFPGSSAEWGRL